MVGAVIVVTVGMLPLLPDDEGWDRLGWFIWLLVLGAGAALVAGAVTLWNRLRAADAPYAGQTALAFLPVAVLMGAVTAGVGALVAPPVARWLVLGLHDPAEPGYGPAPTTTLGRLSATGVWPRLLLTVVVVWLALLWLLDEVGHAVGGEVHGSLLTWAAALPVVVVVPVVLLGRRSWALTAALAVAGAAFAVPVAQDATRFAHPSVERLDRDVSAVGLPAGTTERQHVVTTRESAFTSDFDRDLPVVVVGADAQLDGDLEPLATETTGFLSPATARGKEVATAWAEEFRAAGWEQPNASPEHRVPPGLQDLLGRPGVVHLGYGTWVDTVIVPGGDGAVALTITRP